MLIDHRERLLREPALRDLANWPAIAPDSIAPDKRATFRRNWRAVQMALQGHPYGEIRRVTGCHPAQLTRLLSRALAGAEEIPPPLTRALIPGERLGTPLRHKPLSRLDAPTGARAAFQHLLDTVPQLRENLDKLLEPSLDQSARGENMTPARFHAAFLDLLERAHHPSVCYPYTEDSLGYESLRTYLHARRDELLSERLARQAPKRITMASEQPFEIGREIQIDEQIYDGESAVYLELSGNLAPVRIARFSLALVSDADSTCTLAYRLAFTHHCSQYDVLDTLQQATIPTAPATLRTPGIRVPPGPCFPNQLAEDYARIAFETVALDNALAHCARSVEKYVCDHHFGTVSLGLPATPKPRHVIEQAFRLLSAHAKRHKSTSGAHPNDPLREGKRQRKRPPVVTVDELDEAIYAVLARHNTEPKAYLNASSPLELYQYMMRERPLRLLADSTPAQRSPFELTATVTVKWLKHEHRSPHINFYGCRYKGACLAPLAHQTVTLIYDHRDIRALQVMTADGRIVGTVLAPKTWQHFPHGVKTRQYILRLCRMKRLRLKDPLSEYFWLQLQRKKQKKASLEMLRLYREYSGVVRPRRDTDEPAPQENSTKPHGSEAPPAESASPTEPVPPWTPGFAYTKDADR